MRFYQWQDKQTLLLNVYIQPRASHDEISGVYNQHLKLRLRAPPIDGKANAYLCKYLAKLFGVAKNKVQLIKGHNTRYKQLSIQGVAVLPEVLEPYLALSQI